MGTAFEGRIELNGHPTWLKDWGGDRQVLLLLHGGFVGTETNFGTLIPFLEPHHRLVGFDRRGHGRTADSAEPFSYRTMADETAAVIEHLAVGPVRAVGYSDGGNLLLDLAQRRPELLECMVLIGANYHHDGLLPEVLPMFESTTTDEVMGGAYASQTPDGADHWRRVADKGLDMARTQPTFTLENLRAISTPTLVMAGDDDLVPLSHTCAMFESLPNAQLAVVPGASHMCGWERPELVASHITTFVTNPTPNRLMAVQRT